MKTTYRAEWGSSIVEISADFAQASDQIMGDPCGRQVADFHSPKAAMAAVIEAHFGPANQDEIDEAVAGMVEIN